MGFSAIVDGDYNRTRANTRLYIRVHRADYFVKWGLLTVSVLGYATYESGLKMKLHEDYYKRLLDETLDAAMVEFIAKEDAQELLNEKAMPVECPYNEPEPLFNRTYNFRLPAEFSLRDTSALYQYIYDCVKTDAVYAEIEDMLEDPDLQTIRDF